MNYEKLYVIASELVGKRVRINPDMVHELCPSRGQTGVVIRLQENVEKTGKRYPLCIVRMDKPHAAWAKEIGFLPEELDITN